MKPLISVIVPVYNAGVFFTTLLDSILAQTFTQFELMLVLDCPTDGSDKVAKEYAARDARILIVENSRNLNIGLSRNKGLEVAQGDYIAFADHDDYVYPTWLAKLYQKAVQVDADVVVSDIENSKVTTNGKDAEPVVSGKENSKDYYRFPQVEGETLRQGMLQAMVCSKYSIANSQCFDNANSIWNQLYNRRFLNEHGILFHNNQCVSYEDALFNIEVFVCAQNVALVPEALYVHITHQNNEFGSYGYKCFEKISTYLQLLYRLGQAYHLEQQWVGEAILRKLYVCVFNEYHFKGLRNTLRLLWQLRCQKCEVIDQQALRSYKESKPALSLPKKIFLLWLS
jgi:glycosyltransferase involved in cell wall biosynthesis